MRTRVVKNLWGVSVSSCMSRDTVTVTVSHHLLGVRVVVNHQSDLFPAFRVFGFEPKKYDSTVRLQVHRITHKLVI